jgi:hypothetical protein
MKPQNLPHKNGKPKANYCYKKNPILLYLIMNVNNSNNNNNNNALMPPHHNFLHQLFFFFFTMEKKHLSEHLVSLP